MKRTWMFLLLAVSAAAYAEEPRNFCDQGSCSAQEQKIWDAFEASQLSQPQDLSPHVYSGECYHTGYGYNNEVLQYGVGLFAPTAHQDASAIYFSGRFAFFYKSDPYADLTPETALQDFPDHGVKPESLVYQDGQSGEVDFSTKDQLWRYWMRTSADGKTLYVVALWSVQHTVFCEWTRHD